MSKLKTKRKTAKNKGTAAALAAAGKAVSEAYEDFVKAKAAHDMLLEGCRVAHVPVVLPLSSFYQYRIPTVRPAKPFHGALTPNLEKLVYPIIKNGIITHPQPGSYWFFPNFGGLPFAQ